MEVTIATSQAEKRLAEATDVEKSESARDTPAARRRPDHFMYRLSIFSAGQRNDPQDTGSPGARPQVIEYAASGAESLGRSNSGDFGPAVLYCEDRVPLVPDIEKAPLRRHASRVAIEPFEPNRLSS